MANLVQYIVVCGDLVRKWNWPLGAVIAQCCHATTAVNHIHRDDASTVSYFSDLDRMHKVVLEVISMQCILCVAQFQPYFFYYQVKSEDDLRTLGEKLTENDIKHKLWIEMPENIATCIAIKPYERNAVHPFVKNLKLFK